MGILWQLNPNKVLEMSFGEDRIFLNSDATVSELISIFENLNHSAMDRSKSPKPLQQNLQEKQSSKQKPGLAPKPMTRSLSQMGIDGLGESASRTTYYLSPSTKRNNTFSVKARNMPTNDSVYSKNSEKYIYSLLEVPPIPPRTNTDSIEDKINISPNLPTYPLPQTHKGFQKPMPTNPKSQVNIQRRESKEISSKPGLQSRRTSKAEKLHILQSSLIDIINIIGTEDGEENEEDNHSTEGDSDFDNEENVEQSNKRELNIRRNDRPLRENFDELFSSTSSSFKISELRGTSKMEMNRHEFISLPLERKRDGQAYNERADHSEEVLLRIQRFKETENNYLMELNEVIQELKSEMESPTRKSSLKDENYSTIDQLYETQQEFLETLEYRNDDAFSISTTFHYFDYLFDLYARFLRVNLDSQRETETASKPMLNEKGQSLSYLLLFRLSRYKRFLEIIIDQLDYEEKDVGDVKNVLQIICLAMEESNDKTATASDLNSSRQDKKNQGEKKIFIGKKHPRCQYDTSGFGPLLLHDQFKVDTLNNMNCTALLFEKIIILTEEESQNTFFYKDSIKLDQIVLLRPEKKELRIRNHHKSKLFNKDFNINMKATSEKVKIRWYNAITKCLLDQRYQIKKEVSRSKK